MRFTVESWVKGADFRLQGVEVRRMGLRLWTQGVKGSGSSGEFYCLGFGV